MKKIILIHCWGGKPNYCWYPKAKEELEKEGFQITIPQMPNSDYPEYSEWLKTIQKVAGEVDENTYLIGHSLGCITILRYLEGLKEEKKIVSHSSKQIQFISPFKKGEKIDAKKT